MTEKISLPFVNKGKEFEPPMWTLKDQLDHDKIMSKYLVEYKLKPDDDQYLHAFNEQLVLRQLRKIDDKVSSDSIFTMHPRDFIELCNVLYNSGRTGLKAEKNFRKEK